MVGLIPLCFAELRRPMLPLALAQDAMGPDHVDAGGWDAVLTTADEEWVEEPYVLAEKRGAHVRLEGQEVHCQVQRDEVRDQLRGDLEVDRRRGRSAPVALLWRKNCVAWGPPLTGTGWTVRTLGEPDWGEPRAEEALEGERVDLLLGHPPAGTWRCSAPADLRPPGLLWGSSAAGDDDGASRARALEHDNEGVKAGLGLEAYAETGGAVSPLAHPRGSKLDCANQN